MDPVVLVNMMRANIGKCIDFKIMQPGGLRIAAMKYGFRIVGVDDQGGINSEYIVNKNQEIHNVWQGDILRGPYVCPENLPPNNVQMMGGKRRSRKQKRGRKGKSRRRRY